LRRRWLLAASASVAGCSVLPARPYLEKREWPLDVRRPETLPPNPKGKVLLVRTLRAAPGLEARGLQVVQSDGSIRTDFYEEWSVPPADAMEDVLRRWLAASGLFSAVLAPGSRLRADLALEGELLSLLATPATHVSRASLGLVLLDLRPSPVRVLLQADAAATAPIEAVGPPGLAQAGQAAVSRLMMLVERRITIALAS
jgi:cholesterol transport system auxiliary component